MTRLDGRYLPSLITVTASTFLAMLAYAGPLGNAATLNAAFDAGPAGGTWILASMSVGLAAALVTAGVVADRLGHRRVFLIGAAIFVVANLICAAVTSVALFVVARVIVGVGAAGVIATGLGLVAAVSDHGGHRLRTAVWWSAAMGSGIALGPVITGLFDLGGLWRLYYLLLAVAGAALWTAARALPGETATRRPDRRLDLAGFILLTVALTTTVSAIVEVRAGASTMALVLAVVAVVAVCALIASQRYGSARLIDAALFRRRPFLASTVAAFGTGIGVIAAMSYASTFAVRGFDLSTLQCGGLLAIWSGTSAVAALVFARFGGVLSGPAHLIGGLGGVAVGLLLMSGLSADSSPLRLIPGLFVAGVASGLLNTGLARQAVATVPAEDAAMGSGVNNTARYIGSSLGVTVAGVLASGAPAAVDGWNSIAVSAAAASIVCAAAVLLLGARSSSAGVD